jgi:hypothetical protein
MPYPEENKEMLNKYNGACMLFTPGEVRALKAVVERCAALIGENDIGALMHSDVRRYFETNAHTPLDKYGMRDYSQAFADLCRKLEQFPLRVFTVDGKPIYPGDKVWIGPPSNDIVGEIHEATVGCVEAKKIWYTETILDYQGCKLTWVYSTREAAEKAKASDPVYPDHPI